MEAPFGLGKWTGPPPPPTTTTRVTRTSTNLQVIPWLLTSDEASGYPPAHFRHSGPFCGVRHWHYEYGEEGELSRLSGNQVR
jgi:hypothetical protein